MADSGGSRILRGGGVNIQFPQIFPQKYMKLKEIGNRGGTSLAPPF